jgi:hypothetical protein
MTCPLFLFLEQWIHCIERILYDDYHLPEDDNHHSHRRGNLKSYRILYVYGSSPMWKQWGIIAHHPMYSCHEKFLALFRAKYKIRSKRTCENN